jgi:hypothetical protein
VTPAVARRSFAVTAAAAALQFGGHCAGSAAMVLAGAPTASVPARADEIERLGALRRDGGPRDVLHALG